MIFYGYDQFSASEAVVVGEAVERIKYGIGIALLIEDIAYLTGKAHLLNFIHNLCVEKRHRAVKAVFYLLSYD